MVIDHFAYAMLIRVLALRFRQPLLTSEIKGDMIHCTGKERG